jgi:hypothetical protein
MDSGNNALKIFVQFNENVHLTGNKIWGKIISNLPTLFFFTTLAETQHFLNPHSY